MGRYGSKDVTVTYDDAPGGTPRVVTSFILNFGEVTIDVATEDAAAFGDAWAKYLASGRRSMPDIQVSGFFETTATTGPHAVFRVTDNDADPNASTRTLTVVYGDSKTFTVETLATKYTVKVENGKLTQFSGTIKPTGEGVWS